jgi:hypothetical protein
MQVLFACSKIQPLFGTHLKPQPISNNDSFQSQFQLNLAKKPTDVFFSGLLMFQEPNETPQNTSNKAKDSKPVQESQNRQSSNPNQQDNTTPPNNGEGGRNISNANRQAHNLDQIGNPENPGQRLWRFLR